MKVVQMDIAPQFTVVAKKCDRCRLIFDFDDPTALRIDIDADADGNQLAADFCKSCGSEFLAAIASWTSAFRTITQYVPEKGGRHYHYEVLDAATKGTFRIQPLHDDPELR